MSIYRVQNIVRQNIVVKMSCVNLSCVRIYRLGQNLVGHNIVGQNIFVTKYRLAPNIVTLVYQNEQCLVLSVQYEAQKQTHLVTI
jgi:hypothetical protein